MKTVHAREVSNIKMVSGNEKKYTKIIHNGIVKEWVGIGWIPLNEATQEDNEKYPTVVY